MNITRIQKNPRNKVRTSCFLLESFDFNQYEFEKGNTTIRITRSLQLSFVVFVTPRNLYRYKLGKIIMTGICIGIN